MVDSVSLRLDPLSGANAQHSPPFLTWENKDSSCCECSLPTGWSCPFSRELPLAEWKPPRVGAYTLPQGNSHSVKRSNTGVQKASSLASDGTTFGTVHSLSRLGGQAEARLQLTPCPCSAPSPILSSLPLLFPGEYSPKKSRAPESLSQALPLEP